MLFSNDRIATYINDNFEPAWQSMRPVPTVKIDFGNGHIVTRTLHGNIATYVCSANLEIYDILPGLYEPTTYLAQLEQLFRLSRYVERSPHAEALRDYHQQKATGSDHPSDQLILARTGRGRSITGQELGVKYVLRRVDRRVSPAKSRRSKAAPRIVTPTGMTVEAWRLLQEDTRINETTRRAMIHQYLAGRPRSRPVDVQGWLYREVMQADLEDPLMGLGKLLGRTTTRSPHEG